MEEECETSLTLHYRSTRKGFTQFVKGEEPRRRAGAEPTVVVISAGKCALPSPPGQLSQVGRQFYNTDIEVEILSKEETEKMTYVVRIPARRRPTRFIRKLVYAKVFIEMGIRGTS